MCDCILPSLGYQSWTAMGYYSLGQGVSVGAVIYLSNVLGTNTNHSDCSPGPGNPNWDGPFTLEEITRNLQLSKANA